VSSRSDEFGGTPQGAAQRAVPTSSPFAGGTSAANRAMETPARSNSLKNGRPSPGHHFPRA